MLVTGLLNVPWEALYNPDDPGGGFLSDRCSIITRWPEQTGNAERDLVTTPTVFGRPRIVCLDSVLAGDPQAMEGTSLIATLREEGEHVHMPISRSELVKSVSDVRMVHWICEHAERGLRLTEEVFYTEDDAVAHRFPRGSTLVLTSCRSGGSTMSEIGIAAGICVASECTVIAPSSVVATRVGVQFVRRVNAILRENHASAEVRLVDLWSALKGTDPCAIGPREPKLSAERCYALWNGNLWQRGNSSGRTIVMNLIITERDYELSLNRTEVKKLKGHEQEPILGPDDAADVLDALPKVLADRFRRMLPDNYEMSELQLKFSISGAPFGVGVAGEALVKFAPKRA